MQSGNLKVSVIQIVIPKLENLAKVSEISLN